MRKTMIRAVIACPTIVILSAVCTYNGLSKARASAYSPEYSQYIVEQKTADIIVACANELEVVDYYEEVFVSTYSATTDTRPMMEVSIMSMSDERQSVPSVKIKGVDGKWVDSEEHLVDSDALMQVWNSEYEQPSWDHKGKIKLIHTLWEFLVLQNDVDEVLASALIGNIMYEGTFGMQESSYNIISNIDQARSLLGDGERGYGIAQWTYHRRQDTLLNYYELTNEIYPDDWQRACIVAECCFLLEEVKAYKVFDSLYSHTTIEDSVGRVAVLYEKYDGSFQQWSKQDDGYKLVSSDGSGHGRLKYAQDIYEYFVGD